jgi:hypothetical protein
MVLARGIAPVVDGVSQELFGLALAAHLPADCAKAAHHAERDGVSVTVQAAARFQ